MKRKPFLYVLCVWIREVKKWWKTEKLAIVQVQSGQ
jgi:hypothetical protein